MRRRKKIMQVAPSSSKVKAGPAKVKRSANA